MSILKNQNEKKIYKKLPYLCVLKICNCAQTENNSKKQEKHYVVYIGLSPGLKTKEKIRLKEQTKKWSQKSDFKDCEN